MPALQTGSAGRETRPLQACHSERSEESASSVPFSKSFLKWQFEKYHNFAFCALHFALKVRAGYGGQRSGRPTGGAGRPGAGPYGRVILSAAKNPHPRPLLPDASSGRGMADKQCLSLQAGLLPVARGPLPAPSYHGSPRFATETGRNCAGFPKNLEKLSENYEKPLKTEKIHVIVYCI